MFQFENIIILETYLTLLHQKYQQRHKSRNNIEVTVHSVSLQFCCIIHNFLNFFFALSKMGWLDDRSGTPHLIRS